MDASPAVSAAPSATPRLLRGAQLSLMVLLFAGVAVLATWGAVAALLQQRQHDAVDAETKQNANLARALQEQTARVVATVDQAMLRVQQAMLAGQFDDHDLVRYANETGMVPAILTQISHIGPDGLFLGSNLDPDGAKTGHVDLSQREHVAIHLWPERVPQARQLIMANGLFVGRPVLGKVSNKRTIQLSRRVARADGTVLGVIVASLEVGYFEQTYAGVDLGRQGGVTLAGADGVVRARVIGGAASSTDNQVPRERMAQPQGHYTAISSLDGLERIIAFQRVAAYPLYVFVATGKAEALADWASYRTILVTLTGVLDLAILAAAGIFVASIRRLEDKNRALLASEREARAANSAKTEFLAAMSHELRTPLTSILGFSQLMEVRLADPRYRETAGLISKSAQHLNELLTEILDFSKIEAGAMTLNNAPHDLRELVQGVADLFRISATDKGLALDCRIADDVPATLVCDSLRFKQVLNNLLSNAIKFTDSGRVDIDVSRSGGQLLFRVTDTGPGIDPAKHEQVFERFRQGDAKVSYQHGGTGLGLALARGLAQLIGRDADAGIPAPGDGASFTLALPAARS